MPMDRIPSILIISWHRREYFEKMIANLLADTSDFRLYFWDNGSTDGVRDIIADLRDDRIAEKKFLPENMGQFSAWHWFLDNCAGDIVGKLDDDIIGPHGWTQRLSEIIAFDKRIGALGAWVFQKSDWDNELAAHKIIHVGPYRIFRNFRVAGCAFLGRKAALERYSSRDPATLGVPIMYGPMAKAGYISGYPLPIAFAENLDDPRSPHCRMNRPGGWDQYAAYTARMRSFSGPEEYGRWIAADARRVLETPLADQMRAAFPSRLDRAKDMFTKQFQKIGGQG
jgi:glycosyltransferase involved in cell wall biosynthesis